MRKIGLAVIAAGSLAAAGCATYPNQNGYDPYYNNGYKNGYYGQPKAQASASGRARSPARSSAAFSAQRSTDGNIIAIRAAIAIMSTSMASRITATTFAARSET